MGNALVVLNQVSQERNEFEVFFFQRDIGSFQAGEGQQFADQSIHAHQFAFKALEVLLLFLRLRLNQADNRLHTRQRRTHFMRNVVEQVAFFGNEFFQFFRHFVELDGKVGQFVVTVVNLLGNTGFEFAVGYSVHAATQNFNRLGNVVGKDVCHQEPHNDDKRQNDKFVPNRRKRQAGNEERAREALGLMIVPAFNKEEVFFAETVVFDVCQIRFGVVDGKDTGTLNGEAVDVSA